MNSFKKLESSLLLLKRGTGEGFEYYRWANEAGMFSVLHSMFTKDKGELDELEEH